MVQGLLCLALMGQIPSAGVSPEQDDAALRAVFFSNQHQGCAVGDGGVIWTTADAGASWTRQTSPVVGTHQSVWFVNPRVGWIAGGHTKAGSNEACGYVLQTQDGGASWQQLAGQIEPITTSQHFRVRCLPRLKRIRFFTDRIGMAVGQSNRFFPSGVLRTTDGGRSWESVAGPEGSWRCGWFLNPESGIVAGQLNLRAVLQGETLVKPLNQFGGLQAWRDVRLNASGVPGWMVGDGGRVAVSPDGGITWQAPPTMPARRADFVTFRAVTTYGTNVWIAGSPGSVVWHSADGGKTWEGQQTGQSVALRSLHFTDEKHGCAVGDLGVTLMTSDGGETWRAVRGGGRRFCLLVAVPRSERVPLGLVAAQAGEQGYRSAVMIPPRPDVRSAAQSDEAEDRLSEAVVRSFGSRGEYLWQFPIDVAGLDRHESRLVERWQQRTEGRLPDVMLSAFVARLREMRPDVVVLDEEAPDDAAARVVNAAIRRAIALAGDPAWFPEHQQAAGLRPWSPKRVYQRTGDSGGAWTVQPHDLLARRQQTVGTATAISRVVLRKASRSEGCALTRLVPEAAAEITGRSLFAGLKLEPGSASRRRLIPYNARKVEELEAIAVRQRNVASYADRYFRNPRHAAQLVAQLDELRRGLPDAAAATQLQALADRYASVQQFELSAATRRELIKYYPRTPQASAAREWLVHWWGGAEPTWQQLRRTRATGRIDSIRLTAGERPGSVTAPKKVLTPQGFNEDILAAGQSERRSAIVRNRRQSAVHMLKELKAADPLRFQKSSLQMSMAALFRQSGQAASARSICARKDHDAVWQAAASGEMSLNPNIIEPGKAVHRARRAVSPPKLDGILSDACWANAAEMWLRGRTIDTEKGSFTMMSWDDEYLYLAAAVGKHGSTKEVRPQMRGRTYDADFGNHDRIAWFIDVDRDYATWYRLEVDQRGRTADRCWVDDSWNPKWYVAVDADDSHWRVEAAIAWHELIPAAPDRRTTFAVGARRLLPGYGASGWATPGTAEPDPARFGFVQFR